MNRNTRYRPNSGSGSLGTYRNSENAREQFQQRGAKPQPKMAPMIKPFNRKRQYGNDQSSRNFVTYDTNQGGTQNFAYLYDNVAGPSYDHGYIPNKKRQKINVWDIDVFGNNQSPAFQPTNTYADRQNSPPRPLMSLSGMPPKIRRIPNVPPKVPKNSAPGKAAKPVKPKPVDKPIKSAAKPSEKEPLILRADKVPCQQMVGRLELALGSILKEMKANLCLSSETYSLFTSKVIQRAVKQTIRERIKTVMLNKPIGKYVEIIEAYRKHFPQSTDKDVLDMAIIKTGSAEQHIKMNFDKLLISKVNIMFKKLQILITEKETEVAKLIEARQVFKDDKKSPEDIKQSVKNETEYYSSVVDSLLGARLPKILPNYASCIVKLMKRQGILPQTGDDDEDGPIELPDSDDEEVIEVIPYMEEMDEEPMILTESNDSVQEVMAKTKDEEEAKGVSKVQKEDTKEDVNIENVTVKMETKPDMKTVDSNEVKSEPTENKTEELKDKTEELKGKTEDNAELEKTSNEKVAAASPPFLVKVLCQPELPSKAEAYKFLNKFNMAGVKKHKTIQNLLVVGFNNEKDYNDILAANGTVIEKSTLIIKGNKQQQATETSSPTTKVDTKVDAPSSENQLLTPEMENEITDLLSSIDEQKESNDTSTEGETETSVQGTTPNDNPSMDSRSKPDKQETELAAIKETDESQEDEPDEPSTEANLDENKNGDDGETASKDIANVDETSADNDKTAPESINKPDNEESGNIGTPLKVNKDGRNTPVRASSRLAATPSTVKTRRASRLTQIN